MNDPGRRGLWAAGVGCAFQLIGFSWDGILHKLDPELAARESVFSLANPSHALVALGLGLTVLGVAWALFVAGSERVRTLPPFSGQTVGALLLVALLAVMGGIAVSSGGLIQTHPHDGAQEAGGHAHDSDSLSAASVSGPVIDELRAVLERDGLERSLDRLEQLAGEDERVLSNAHTYAHELGRTAFHRYGSAKAAFSRCRELFQSGCYHGVLEAHFDANPRIDPAAVAGLCDATVGANSALALRFQCVHGLGHGLTAHARHDIFQALRYCDFLRTEWDRDSCYGGAFMENIIFAQAQARGGDGHQHSHGADHQTHVRADDLLYPCSAVAEKYRRECYTMQTSIVLWLNGYDYQGAFSTCESAPAAHVNTCYQSLGRDISGNTLRNSDEALRLCALGRMPHRPFCHVGAVKNFIDVTWRTDQAIDFCRRVPDDSKSACYTAIGEQVALLHTDAGRKADECARMEPAHIPTCDRAAAVRR